MQSFSNVPKLVLGFNPLVVREEFVTAAQGLCGPTWWDGGQFLLKELIDRKPIEVTSIRVSDRDSEWWVYS